MIKMFSACTEEIDEIQDAVDEILEQLDLGHNLLKNAVGLISCYSEFIATGVVEALCAALPFEVVGSTTIGNSTAGQAGMMMLCLSVLTSDDVTFTTYHSGPMQGDTRTLADSYREAAGKLGQKPGLILGYFPFIRELGGEILLDTMQEVVDGVPIFGTIGCDHHTDYHTTATIHNGESFNDSGAFVLFSGDVKARFIVSAISARKLQQQRATITGSEGALLKEVNGIPATDYLETVGLKVGAGIEGMMTIPLLVEYGDDTPAVARAMYLLLPDGNIVCGANMPEGAVITLGTLEDDDVVATAEAVARDIAGSGASGALVFSCLSRFAVLGAEQTREMDAFEAVLEGLPCHISYAGGEVSPVYNQQGVPANRFHNFSIVACVFE